MNRRKPSQFDDVAESYQVPPEGHEIYVDVSALRILPDWWAWNVWMGRLVRYTQQTSQPHDPQSPPSFTHIHSAMPSAQ